MPILCASGEEARRKQKIVLTTAINLTYWTITGGIYYFIFFFLPWTDGRWRFFYKFFPRSLQKSTKSVLLLLFIRMTCFVDRKSIGFILHRRQQRQQQQQHTRRDESKLIISTSCCCFPPFFLFPVRTFYTCTTKKFIIRRYTLIYLIKVSCLYFF